MKGARGEAAEESLLHRDDALCRVITKNLDSSRSSEMIQCFLYGPILASIASDGNAEVRIAAWRLEQRCAFQAYLRRETRK